jgi:phage terminase large subunit-like protein
MAKTKSKYYYDEAAADLAVTFIQKFCFHTTGRWAGLPFILEPWQRDLVETIFGWKRMADGLRRYRMVYVEIPKKNGKSTFAAALALLLLVMDNEPRAEVYSAAGDRSQAGIVFDIGKQMCKQSPRIDAVTECYRDSIFVPTTFSKYQVINAEAGTKHGINIHALLFDELHVQRNRELWDTLVNGIASREQPLIIAFTTAGWDRNSICWEQHEYARQVIDGVIKDDEFLGVIYAADPDDDWTDPEVWKKANPGFGVTISESYLRTACERAQRVPAQQNAFRRLHLNQWTEQSSRWLELQMWRDNELGVTLESMAGRQCYAGGDLASTRDLTAFCFMFPPDDDWPMWIVIPRFYMPESNIKKRNDESQGKYLMWHQAGYILTTPGDVTDYDWIREDLKTIGESIHINELAMDRWNATQLMIQLADDGLAVVPFGQGFASMAGPTREFERLIVGGEMCHDGNPVMSWMVSNAAVKMDPAGNMKPDKSKSSEKIDGIVAAIMALGRAIEADPDNGGSVYDEQGITFA